MREGKYVSTITLTPGTGGATTCLMTATFKAATEGVNDKVAGKKIGMQFNSSDGTWKCGTNLDKNIAPAACNGNADSKYSNTIKSIRLIKSIKSVTHQARHNQGGL